MSTNYTGFEWLCIDAANHYGIKGLYPARIRWTMENVVPHLESKYLPVSEIKDVLADVLTKAKEPSMFAGAVLAIFDAIRGTASGWQISRDACASGPALLSTLLGCTTGMRNTGVIGTSKVPDLYAAITESMGSEYDRALVKAATVPHVYGSVRAPRTVWGDEYPKFCAAYTKAVPAAEMVKNLLINGWDSTATEYSFTLPDGAVVKTPVLRTVTKKGYPLGNHTYTYQFTEQGCIARGDVGSKALSANVTHAYDAYISRELGRRCNYDVHQLDKAWEYLNKPGIGKGTVPNELMNLVNMTYRTNQISLVAIEYLTEDNAKTLPVWYQSMLKDLIIKVFQNDPFEINAVHDDFRCLPNYANAMGAHYQQLMVETYKSNWLVWALSMLLGNDYYALRAEVKPEVIQSILAAEYTIS